LTEIGAVKREYSFGLAFPADSNKPLPESASKSSFFSQKEESLMQRQMDSMLLSVFVQSSPPVRPAQSIDKSAGPNFFFLQMPIVEFLDPHLAALVQGKSVEKPKKQVQKDNSLEYAMYLYQSKQYQQAYEILMTQHSNDGKWGKLACEIMLKDYASAFDSIMALKEIIEQSKDQMNSVTQRAWLICWSMFVFFNGQKKDQLLELYTNSVYMSCIQSVCPFVLKYVAVAVLTCSKKRRTVKEFVRTLKQESDNFSSGITDFLIAIFEFDFELVEQKFKAAQSEFKQDYFLKGELNSFVECGRLLILENICRVINFTSFDYLAKLFLSNATEVQKLIADFQQKSDLKFEITETVQIN
jgi:translation initiation factor 3 subunit E